MSFASDIRGELGGLPIKPLCCRRAYLYGLIYAATVTGETVTATFPVIKGSDYHPHEQLVSLAHSLFSREATVLFESRGAHRYARVSFDFKNAASRLRDLSLLPPEEAACETLTHAMGLKCPQCTPHFLRGVFIACGTVNDPARSYHLELKLTDDGRVEPLRILLAEAGYEVGMTLRGGMVGLFLKGGNTIRELLTYMGATSSVFDFFNAQIERSIRNDENRATNCVTENINRAIRTGVRHLTALRYLEDHDLLLALPEELQFTARLRLNNPDITLAELGELHSPPVSKSGVYHRLEKVMDFYEKMGGTTSQA